MTAHPNAHILAQLAEIAKTNDRPWERLEMKNTAGDWVDCSANTPLIHPKATYRIKPATVTIGGEELEGPIREEPREGTKVWLLFDHTPPDEPDYFYAQLPTHTKWLNEGRLFASKEARDKYQNALVKLANGSGV